MCDCYTGKCESCGIEIPIHIGDFSVPRECVEIYCPKPGCRTKFEDKIYGRRRDSGGNITHEHALGPYIIFTQTHVYTKYSTEYDLELPEGTYLFIIDYPRGIHLNT